MADVLCPVVVGRQAELAALDAALTAALGGAGQLVFIVGEPGIGKSRLAREVAGRARREGATVIAGRAVPAGQGTPYRPLTEALLQALRGSPPGGDAELRPWWPALSAIVPGLGGPAGEPSARGDAALGEAVLRLLRWLSRSAGLVIVLEDLHWADPDSLTVVEYLADNLADQPVLCLATSRDEPPTAALDLARRLHGRRAARLVPLTRLEEGHVAEMVRACLPDPGPDVIAQVQRTADGVPFLVEEVLAAPGMPASFRDTVRARLAALAEPERLVLQAAAILGRHFDWRLLAPVTGQPAAVVSQALEGGVDQLLLAVQDGEFRFRHALTREAIAADVLPPTRVALAAAALAALGTAGFGPAHRDTAADLAVQADQAERAGLLLIETGQDALDRGALATAAQTFRRAARLLSAPAARDQADSGLLEALALAGRFDEAMTVGAGLAARLGRDAAWVHLRLAHAAVAATRWAAARDQLAAAARLPAGGPLRAEALVLQAEVAMAADELGAMSTAAVLDLQLAAAADARFELDELARFAQDALEISERLGIDGVRAKALLFLVESRALRADRAGTERYAALALAAAGGRGRPARRRRDRGRAERWGHHGVRQPRHGPLRRGDPGRAGRGRRPGGRACRGWAPRARRLPGLVGPGPDARGRSGAGRRLG